MLLAPKLQKRIRFAGSKQAMALLFLGVFFGSLLITFASPLLPRTYAANGGNFALYVGEDGDYQRAIADAYNAGGGDEYDNGGWKNIKIFTKNLDGLGNVTLNYNEDTTKKIACMGSGPIIPDECESREPIFTKTYFCTLPDERTTASRPASEATEYYEITYAIVLRGNGTSGDDFVKRQGYNGIGGITKVKKFEKPNDNATYTREVVTRDLIHGSTAADHLDDARRDGKNGREDDDWGIDSQDSGCRPPAAIIGSMNMKNFGKLSTAQKADFNPPTTDTNGGGGGAAGAGGDPQVDPCDDIGKLGWIVCPVVTAVTEAINELDTAINNLLTIDTQPIFNNNDEESTGAAYYRSWNAFRVVALGLMVIAALVVIISTAFGYEMLDAYTIRKVLPRFLIAVIFITLSWDILEFLVTLTNDVGNGIRALIYQPFTDAMGPNIDFSAGTAMLINTLLGASFIALGAMGLLSFGLTALLAVLIAFLVLVVRELIVIFLVIIAPLAIACLILPNTRKAWQLWQNTLTAMLIIFPIIAAMIATGRVFALTTSQSGDDLLTQLLAFTAYLLPYFMLPFAFRAAGGLMATLAGFANDRSRGVFDRLKNNRGQRMGENWNKLKSGQRFNEDHIAAPLTRRFNTFSRGAANLGAAGMNPRRMRSRMQAAMSTHGFEEAQENMEKNAHLKAILANDDYLNASNAATNHVGNPHTDAGVRAYLQAQGYQGQGLEQGVAAVREARRSMSRESFEIATTMANAGTGTAYAGGAGEMMESINTVAGSDRHLANRMLGSMRGTAERARRVDLAGSGFGTQSRLMEEMYAGTTTGGEASEQVARAALEVQGAGSIVGARGNAVRNLAPHMVNELREAYGTGNEVTINRALARVAGRYDEMARNAPENAEILADSLLTQHLPNGQTIQAAIEEARTNPEFLNMRREYGRNPETMGGGGAGVAPPTDEPH